MKLIALFVAFTCLVPYLAGAYLEGRASIGVAAIIIVALIVIEACRLVHKK